MPSLGVRGTAGSASPSGVNNFNPPHGLGDTDTGSEGSDFSRDTLDELLSCIQCSYSPVLKAKVSWRLGSRDRSRGKVGVSCCAFPWEYHGRDLRTNLPKFWTELQYKPVKNGLLHSVRLSNRDTSLKLYSTPWRLPGWLWWVRAQVSMGLAAQLPGKSGSVRPVVHWVVCPQQACSSALKQQIGRNGVHLRNALKVSVAYPEFEGCALEGTNMLAECRGVGLDRTPQGQEFRASVSWETLELRWNVDRTAEQQVDAPNDNVRQESAGRKKWPLWRAQEPELVKPVDPKPQTLRERFGFRQWRSSALLTTWV